MGPDRRQTESTTSSDPASVCTVLQRQMSTIAIQELDRAVERLESHGELSPAQRQAVQACAEGIVARFLTRFTYRIDEVDEQEVERLFDLENK